MPSLDQRFALRSCKEQIEQSALAKLNRFSRIQKEQGCKHTIQSCEGEHSNLRNNVLPSIRSNSGCLEVVGEKIVKLLAHGNDAIRHSLDIRFPLRKELGLVQDQRNLLSFHLNALVRILIDGNRK